VVKYCKVELINNSDVSGFNQEKSTKEPSKSTPEKPRKTIVRVGGLLTSWTPTKKRGKRYIQCDPNAKFFKGKTVEVGRATFETPTKRYTILDAPGHKNYVPNMIGGASQADVGILVISARKGEFETGFTKAGQTKEHTMLAKTLGVKYLIVVINKMDDPTVEWAHERCVSFARQHFNIFSDMKKLSRS
jgi:translation initiation factor IF-2